MLETVNVVVYVPSSTTMMRVLFASWLRAVANVHGEVFVHAVPEPLGPT